MRQKRTLGSRPEADSRNDHYGGKADISALALQAHRDALEQHLLYGEPGDGGPADAGTALRHPADDEPPAAGTGEMPGTAGNHREVQAK